MSVLHLFSRRRAMLLLLAGSVAAVALGYLAWPGQRQTLPGRLPEYHKVYDGFWDVICNTAMDGSDRQCHIQYVDVYRLPPDFAAAMVEVVYHRGADGLPDPHVRFDIEPGLSFRDTTVRVVTPGGPIALDMSDCGTNTCRRSGDAGRAILAALRQGVSLELEIGEGRDTPARSVWPLGNINAILDDFAAQRRARGLP